MHHLKKSYICKLTLLIYFLVIAIVPLTEMHVENWNDRQEFIVVHNPDPSADDVILLLHEILFSHFYKKVNYSSNMFSHGKAFAKTARANISLKFASAENIKSETLAINIHENPSRYSGIHDGKPKLFSGFSHLFSGSSPPLG